MSPKIDLAENVIDCCCFCGNLVILGVDRYYQLRCSPHANLHLFVAFKTQSGAAYRCFSRQMN